MTSIMALLGVIGLLVLTVSGDSTGSGGETKNCAEDLDGGGWTLVRHSYNKWPDADDNLVGTAEYGTVSGPTSDNEFAVAFDAADDTQFLFSNGDCDRWLITTFDQFGYQWGSSYDATILKSCISDTPYTAKWYNRVQFADVADPWIAYKDVLADGKTTILYGENNSKDWPSNYIGQFINVWMREDSNRNSRGFFVIGDQTVAYWDEAERWCLDRGYHFASIHSAAESAVAASLGSGLDSDMWIGGRRVSFDPSSTEYHDWEWVDGTKWNYTNWYPNEPNNEGGNTPENYLMMYRNVEGTWNNRQPPVQHYPLCRRTNFVVGDPVDSWDDADKWCTDRGFKLASIHNAEDNAVAAAMGRALDRDMWLSGRRSSDDKSKWEWSDGTEWDYENWHEGEPNNQNEECLMLYQSGTWNDRDCDVVGFRPLCEFKPKYQYVSMEEVDGENMMIGWVEYASCVEGSNPPVFNDAQSSMHSSAITVKILPSTDVPGHSETSDYAVMAKMCSNPIYAFNSGYAMSWVVDQTTDPPLITDLADTDNWIGDNAATLMRSDCLYGQQSGVEPPTLDDRIYHAACNGAGMHIRQRDNGNSECYFDHGTTVGHDITVWMGFDAVDQRACSLKSDGSYSLEPKPAPPVTSHWIAAGNRLNSRWNSIPTTECMADSSVQAPQGTAYGTDIGVSCCSDGGSAMRRFSASDNSDCRQAKTFEEASKMCTQYGAGWRLCTLDEMLALKTKGKGCYHDYRYNWVSTPCGDGSDSINAAASSNVDGPNEMTGSGEGATSFEFDDFLPIVLGAAGGIAVIAAIVTVVVAMRKRKTASTEPVVEAVHVPDDSVMTNTAKETETEMEVVTGTGPDVGVDATE